MGYGYGSWIREGEMVSDFGAGRRIFILPVRIWGIWLRSSPGVVEAFMTDKEKGVDRKTSKKQVRKQI